VHDIADLERRGVPGVFVAEAQVAAVGVDTARVFVPHPIQDRTDDEMRALADAAVDRIVAALVDPGQPST
jgi:hypothetical protein